MTFWKKYNKYFRMAIIVIVYIIMMFTSVPASILAPIREKLGRTILGGESYVIIGNVIIYAVIFVCSLFLVPDIYYVDFKIVKKKKLGKLMAEIGIGYGALLVLTIVGNMVTLIFGGQQDSANETTVNAILQADIAWLYIPVVCIIGPIVEEVVFRGVIQGTIIGSKFNGLDNPRVVIGILVSSVAFGLIHVYQAGDYVQIFPYLFMGIALGVIAYKSKSIYVAIIMHALNNTISVLATMALLVI